MEDKYTKLKRYEVNGKHFMMPEVVTMGSCHQPDTMGRQFTYKPIAQRPVKHGEYYLMSVPERLYRAKGDIEYPYWVVEVLEEVEPSIASTVEWVAK